MGEEDLNEVYNVRDATLMLIGEARTEDAIALLKNFLKGKDKELYSQILLISNQYFEVKKREMLGLGSKEKIFNRINYSLIAFANNHWRILKLPYTFASGEI